MNIVSLIHMNRDVETFATTAHLSVDELSHHAGISDTVPELYQEKRFEDCSARP